MHGCKQIMINTHMIRNILNTLEILTESTGLANRKPGDIFKNSDGQEIVFTSVQFYPEGGGKFTKEELSNAIAEITDGINVQWMNSPSGRTGGFGIASFSSDSGDVYFGRYLEQVKPTVTDNYIPNKLGDYSLASKSASKAQAGLSPQDLLSRKYDLTAEDIVSELSVSLGKDHPLYSLAQRIAAGEKFPLYFTAPEDLSFTAFRDYFCEILQPIALQKGNYSGNAGEAAEIFMDGSFADTTISFDDSKNAGLSDSTLTNTSGKVIKISTKGGAGAKASVSNLIDSIEEIKATPAGKKLLKKYKDVIDLINDIKKYGQHAAPRKLAVKYGIINERESKIIERLRDMAPINLENIDTMDLTPRLKKLALSRTTNTPDNVSLYYHLTAAIAPKVADKINNDTDFSKAASDILNNGALVQVYTKASESGNKWVLKEFNTVYPGKSISGVKITAHKTYYSTGIKGNFTFLIDKGDGIPKDTPEADSSPISAPRTKRDFSKNATKIATGKSTTTKSSTPLGDVGRSKRK